MVITLRSNGPTASDSLKVHSRGSIIRVRSERQETTTGTVSHYRLAALLSRPCLGIAHLAITLDGQSGYGPDNGYERGTVHCHLDCHDDRHDVPHGGSHDLDVQQNLRRQTTATADFRPNLGFRQRLPA